MFFPVVGEVVSATRHTENHFRTDCFHSLLLRLHFAIKKHIPTLPTLTLSIKGLQAGYPTLEATLTPTLENLSTTLSTQTLFPQFSRELVSYSLSNFR